MENLLYKHCWLQPSLLDRTEVTISYKMVLSISQTFFVEEFAPGTDGTASGYRWRKRESWEGTMSRDKTLLLGGHVQDQVAHAVAVAELVVVPADKRWTEIEITESGEHGMLGVCRSRKNIFKKGFKICSLVCSLCEGYMLTCAFWRQDILCNVCNVTPWHLDFLSGWICARVKIVKTKCHKQFVSPLAVG